MISATKKKMMLKKTKQFKLEPKDTGWKFTWINVTTTIASKFDTKREKIMINM